MLAMKTQALVDAIVRSKSFASLRHRPSYANVRSTTHPRGGTSKPLRLSERLMISSVNLLTFCNAPLSFGIASIGKDTAQPRPAFKDHFQDGRCTVVILDIGGMNDETDRQTERVDDAVALAAHDLLSGIKARIPPLSVVLIDWLSMTPAVGLASLPSLSRIAITSSLLMVRSRPSSRQR